MLHGIVMMYDFVMMCDVVMTRHITDTTAMKVSRLPFGQHVVGCISPVEFKLPATGQTSQGTLFWTEVSVE